MQTTSGTATRRTRDEQRAATRARLVEAAADVFARAGFHGASVDDVAEAAGFSKGAVYSNFAGKDELFLAVLDARMGEFVASFAAAFAEAVADPDRRFGSLGDWYARRLRDDREWLLLRTEFWLYAMRRPESRYKLAARQRVLREHVGEAVERQCEALGIPLPAPAEHLASVVVALCEGIASQHVADPQAVPAELLPATLDVLLRALARPPGGTP